MSLPAVAFRCIQPDLITAYQSQCDANMEEFNTKVKDFQETVQRRDLHGINCFDGGFIVQGYNLSSRTEQPLPGWRRDGASNRAVPARRTPEGKAIAEAIKDLVLPGFRFPGCPEVLHSEHRMAFPQVETIGGSYFLELSIEVEPAELAKIDLDIWQPLKLSQFHAIREAASGEAA